MKKSFKTLSLLSVVAFLKKKTFYSVERRTSTRKPCNLKPIAATFRVVRRPGDSAPVPDARDGGVWLRPPASDVIGGVGADWRTDAAAARATLPERHGADGSAAG